MQPVIDTNEYLRRLEAMGWTVTLDVKNGVWEALGRANQKKGEKPKRRIGSSPEWALLNLYNYVINRNMMRAHTAAVQHFGAWQTPWHDMSEQIGRAYAEAPVYDSKAVPHWQALGNESKKQADAIRNQVRVERTAEPDPYLHPKDLASDVHKNQHMFVSTHNLDHPVFNKDQALDFRIAHNVLGHAHSGADHTLLGRNMAVAHHMPMVTGPAREALFMDRVAKPSYHNHFDGNAPHKIGTLSEFLSPVQDQNGEHLYVPHGAMDVLHVAHLQKFDLIDQSTSGRSVFLAL